MGTDASNNNPAARILALEAAVAERDATIATLLERIAALLERIARLEKNSSNSSKPPSSDIASPKPDQREKDRRKKQRQDKAKKRKRGRTQRTADALPDERVDVVVEVPVAFDPAKHEPVPGDFAQFRRAELVDNPVVVTEYRLPRLRDLATGEIFTPAWPAGFEDKSLLGPRLLALTSTLKAQLHGTFRPIQSLYTDVFNLPLSLGLLVKAAERVSVALAGPYEEIAAAARKQTVVNIDETGHKDNGKRCQTWVLTNDLLSLFCVGGTRGHVELQSILGEDFQGVIGSDAYCVYPKHAKENPGVLSQLCLAHLIREVRHVEVLGGLPGNGQAGVWARQMLKHLKELFHWWHRRQWKRGRAARDAILNCCDERWHVFNQTATKLQRRLRKHARSYFRFLEDRGRGIEPTNNAAERALRRLVLHRRVTQGTRGARGRRWWERVFSVTATLRKQGRSAFCYLVEALEAVARGVTPPSPLPPPLQLAT